jgi:hypothetical protein
VTGTSERPSRSSPETRKAAFRTIATTRHALKALHAAERDLLRVSHRAEMTTLAAEVAQQSAKATAAKAQAITALYASKIAAIDPGLSASARAAASARLKDEEAAELATMFLSETRNADSDRKAKRTAVAARHRGIRHAVQGRQRGERVVLSVTSRSRSKLSGGSSPLRRSIAILPSYLRTK